MADRNALMPYWEGTKQAVNHLAGAFDQDVVERTTMLPLGKYEDGLVRPAWPGIIAGPVQAANRMLETPFDPSSATDEEWSRMAEDSFDVAGLAPIGGLAVGAIPEGAIAANGGWGQKIKAWFGNGAAEDVYTKPSPESLLEYSRLISELPRLEQPPASQQGPFNARLFNGASRTYTPEQRAKYGQFWATSSPAEAATYAAPYADPQIMPVDVSFKNPLIVDARGADWDSVPMRLRGGSETRMTTDHIHRSALAYHPDADGLVFQNVVENGDTPSTSVVALKPGTVRSATTGELLYANSPTGSSVPLAVNALEKPQGIRAYHGSPHDFDKFDMSKIGTGEGAQAFGHGLYFAENEGVARSYRDALQQKHSVYGTAEKARDAITTALGFTGDTRIQPQLMAGGNDGYAVFGVEEPGGWFKKPKERFIGSIEKLADGTFFPHSDSAPVRKTGRMYEVNIKAGPEQFLDWDVPLSRQSESVRQALEPLVDPDRQRFAQGTVDPSRPTSFWDQFLHPAGSTFDPMGYEYAGDASFLREAGIPGIRYLDQGSRAVGDGTRNYVLFDDSLVDITRKYANHPVASSSPLAFSDHEQEQENALMPRQHHSRSQPRTPAGQFSK